MFEKRDYRQLEKENEYLREESRKRAATHDIEIAKLVSDHELIIQQKDFDIAHYDSTEMQKLRKTIVGLEQEVAVLQKENSMLDRITDINADVIDIKDLYKKLIEKLPNVNINGLSVVANEGKSGR